MSIQITVTDPANTPRRELALVIQLLQRFFDGSVLDTPVVTGSEAPVTTNGLIVRTADGAPAIPIAPDDNPATGADPTAVFAPPADVATAAFAPQAALASFAGTLPAVVGNVQPVVASIPAPVISDPATSSGPAAIPSAPNASGVTVDKNGLPWDARIHAKGANGPVTNSDGTWRAKRGVEAELVAKVEAELRAVMAIPGPGAAPAAIPTLHLAVDSAGVPAAPNVPPAPTPTSAATAPAIIPTAPAGAGSTALLPEAARFPALIQKISPLLVPGGGLTQAQAHAACQMYTLQDLTQLVNRPDLVPLVEAAIDAMLAPQG